MHTPELWSSWLARFPYTAAILRAKEISRECIYYDQCACRMKDVHMRDVPYKRKRKRERERGRQIVYMLGGETCSWQGDA